VLLCLFLLFLIKFRGKLFFRDQAIYGLPKVLNHKVLLPQKGKGAKVPKKIKNAQELDDGT